MTERGTFRWQIPHRLPNRTAKAGPGEIGRRRPDEERASDSFGWISRSLHFSSLLLVFYLTFSTTSLSPSPSLVRLAYLTHLFGIFRPLHTPLKLVDNTESSIGWQIRVLKAQLYLGKQKNTRLSSSCYPPHLPELWHDPCPL